MTKRQEQILRLAAVGLSNREIAAELGISERTVRTHFTGILRAMGANNRTHAVFLMGWVKFPDELRNEYALELVEDAEPTTQAR
jgi:DNA-binding CsgD family transcriptional regulator